MSVGQHPLQELGVQGVQDVEEVLPRRALAHRVLIGEVSGEEVVAGELRVQVLHRQLLVVRHLYVGHVLLLDELLLIGQDLLEKVLVDERLRRQVELEATQGYKGQYKGRW